MAAMDTKALAEEQQRRNPMFHDHVPLDNLLIANILASYLSTNQFKLSLPCPPFRLRQLIKRATTDFEKNSDLIEATAAFFCVCLHYSQTAYLDDEATFEGITFLISVFVESYAVIARVRGSSINLIHPKALFAREVIAERSTTVVNLLTDGLDLMKEITRDVVKQVRECRIKKVKPKKQSYAEKKRDEAEKPPSDCYKSHTTLFMSALALSHVACLLKTSENLNAIPGLMEAIILMSSLVVDVKEAKDANSGGIVGADILKRIEVNRLIPCVQFTNRLGFTVLNATFTERNILELRMAQTNLLKEIKNPDADYQELIMGARFRSFLSKDINRFVVKIIKDIAPIDIPNDSFRDMNIQVADSIDSGISLPKQLSHPDEASRNDGAAAAEAMLNFKSDAQSSSSKSRSNTPSKSNGKNDGSGSSNNNNNSNKSNSNINNYATIPAIANSAIKRPQKQPKPPPTPAAALEKISDEEMDLYSSFNKEFREIYIIMTSCTRKNMKTKKLYNKLYSKQKTYVRLEGVSDFEGLSNMRLIECSHIIEGLHYNIDSAYSNRAVNPICGLYWITRMILDYFYAETHEGFGFVRDLKETVSGLKHKLNTGIKAASKQFPNLAGRLKEASSLAKLENKLLINENKLKAYNHLHDNKSGIERLEDGLDRNLRIVNKVRKKRVELFGTSSSISRDRSRSRAESGFSDIDFRDTSATATDSPSSPSNSRSPSRGEVGGGGSRSRSRSRAGSEVNESSSPPPSRGRTSKSRSTSFAEVTTPDTKKGDRASPDNLKLELVLPSPSPVKNRNRNASFVDTTNSNSNSSSNSNNEDNNNNNGKSNNNSRSRRSTAVDMSSGSRPPSPDKGSSSSRPNTPGPGTPLGKAMGSAKGSARGSKPGTPSEGYVVDPLLKELHQFKANLEIVARLNFKDHAAEVDLGQVFVSPIWAHVDEKVVIVDPADAFQNIFGDKNPKEAAKELADIIHKQQKEKKLAEMRERMEAKDRHELEQMNIRAYRTAKLRDERDRRKDDILASKALKIKMDEDRKELRRLEKLYKLEEEKARQENISKEQGNIAEMLFIYAEKATNDELIMQEKREMEKIRLKELAGRKEYDEILRRIYEENGMRLCEERRRKIEDARLAVLKKKEDERIELLAKHKDMTDRNIKRVRAGRFIYKDGAMRFYDDVKKTPVEYIQYEDASGIPYYWDPVLQKTTYSVPPDANFRHYTIDERKEYDKLYGRGSYDAMKADRKFKDDYNKNQGYEDELGDWHTATGYYDENYEFVAWEGYYDEKGRYIRYAKAVGNLKFMI